MKTKSNSERKRELASMRVIGVIKAPGSKVPISTRALVARINRKLAPDDRKLCKSRGQQTQLRFGEYYVLDVRRNFITPYQDVGVESLGKELGVLKPYECLAEDLSESEVERLAPAQARRLGLKNKSE